MAGLNEAARQFYLGQAGIHLWYARSPLPGAAPSPDFDFSEPAPEPVAPVSTPIASPQENDRAERAGKLAALQGLMSGKAAPPEENNPPASPAEQAVGTETPATDRAGVIDPPTMDADPVIIQANWGFWCAEDALLVSVLSEDASFQLQASLAQNILKAVGQSALRDFRIQWPVFNNPLVPGSDRGALIRVVREQLANLGGRRVILLGILPGLPDADRAALIAELWGQVAVDMPASLAALSTDPAGKRALWEALKPVFTRGQ
ncbi:MAG: hypothetical protein R3175_17705 [Marinobacter sp.]|uniref:hypothetical protein n=1 Tax=Marinobacter sp. TaxID=50741 RepID=UPI00299E5DDF|nr:hypothetical protein [Marinobacter sp.]MDX1757893.1 hypothetical protein [Marinobacter sp.]